MASQCMHVNHTMPGMLCAHQVYSIMPNSGQLMNLTKLGTVTKLGKTNAGKSLQR